MEEDDPRAAAPQRGEERHAVPDLDQSVPGPDLVTESGERGAGEDGVATGPPVDQVAAAVDLPGLPVHPGGPQADVDAGLGPPGQDLVGVELGSPGLGVLEVPPGHHVHPSQPRAVGDLAQPVAALDPAARSTDGGSPASPRPGPTGRSCHGPGRRPGAEGPTFDATAHTDPPGRVGQYYRRGPVDSTRATGSRPATTARAPR